MNQLVKSNASYSKKIIPGDKHWPNNNNIPVIMYKGAVEISDNSADDIKQLLEGNGWTDAWEGSLYTSHHYHSSAHEVLVVIKGNCMLELGGMDGNIQDLAKGDAIVIPAGVVHKNVGCSDDFKVIGAYPEGQHCNIKGEKEQNREEIEDTIKNVSLPGNDPLFGEKGPLKELWTKEGQCEPSLKKESQF